MLIKEIKTVNLTPNQAKGGADVRIVSTKPPWQKLKNEEP